MSEAPAVEIPQELLPPGCAWEEVDGRRCPVIGPVVIHAVVARGGTGTVFRGRRRAGTVDLVLKVLDPETLPEDPMRTAHVASPHLVHALRTGIDEPTGRRYVVLPHVRGIDAAAWANSARRGRGVPEASALRVALAAARGLAALHAAGWVHRDVSPGNILVPFDASGGADLDRALLADLGHARPVSTEPRLTGRHHLVITYDFAAPEGVTTPVPPGPPADVFSLAATLYSFLAGRAPFTGREDADTLMNAASGRYTPIDAVRGDVSVATRTIVTQCLAVEPERRVPDASALAARLETSLNALVG